MFVAERIVRTRGWGDPPEPVNLKGSSRRREGRRKEPFLCR